MVLQKIKDYGKLVMFSHTIFSFSFALFSMLLAANGLPGAKTIFWIIMAFIGARTGANALNRVIDMNIDAKNPRTADRQLPQGLMNKAEVIIFVVLCFMLLSVAAYMLNPLCFKLLPLALILLIGYSYTKRFTWACHIILGITCAAAPVGAWIAVAGNISWTCLILGAADALWVSGFDIIYGAQDAEFDRKNGLYSIPAYFGVENALKISALFHFISAILLISIYFIEKMSWLYAIGLVIICILLIAEHKMVSSDNLKNAKIASYNINELVSVAFLIFSVSDILILR
ncbi:UbiA-like polyprenyltransferase [Clostridium sp. JN-9]|uniref:UbiA-like polyprenyltransferase n=1 Tax=Clostridium sp. JN-9 TaxID=2507159 RepID=UPI000FFE2D84|nr:UbiA-like polyprenyltransferase [Clostridium sp. JN-9]QAT40405.1 4-hydroxybenzoate octaprenyltransferase [Clostridium sp. JN-9]